MLILKTEYFFDESWRRAARALGWEVASVSSAMTGEITQDQMKDLLTALGEFKPDFILTSNYSGMDAFGLFARFFADVKIPYVSWFTDTPRMILYSRDPAPSYHAVAATWEKDYKQHFTDLGFEHVLHMPLATDPDIFNGTPCEQFARNLAFVGSSMIKEAKEAWEKLEHLPDVTAAINDALDRDRVTPGGVVQGPSAIVNPELLDKCDSSELRHVELCIIYEATRRQRYDMAKALEDSGVEVFGDLLWNESGVPVHRNVLYYEELSDFYRETAINLNTTSVQMSSSVNQRVFDCPASGGFLITDNQRDLEGLFDLDKEVVTYNSLDELRDKVAYYSKHPEERRTITQAAQRRVLAHHTHKNRLEMLETYLKERYAE